MLLLWIVACMPAVSEGGVSQEEFNALAAEVASLRAQVGQEGTETTGEPSDLSEAVAALKARVSALEAVAGDVDQLAGDVDQLAEQLAEVQSRMPGVWMFRVDDPEGGDGADWETIGSEISLKLDTFGPLRATCTATLAVGGYFEAADKLRVAWTDSGDDGGSEQVEYANIVYGENIRFSAETTITPIGDTVIRCESIGMSWSDVALVVLQGAEGAL